jgi:hypothetical protein
MPAVTLTPTETKLLHLALNKAAALGEIENSARMLIESLRRRDVQATDIEQALSKEPAQTKRLVPDYGLRRMLWGPHKGKPLVDVPPHILRNAIRWAHRTPGVAERFADFLSDVEQFLQQGQN